MKISLLERFQPVGGIANTVNPELNPTPGTPEFRIAPANFAPGTTDGLVDAPNARTLSNEVSNQPEDIVDPTGTSAWIYVFGQFVDHDLDLEAVGGADIHIPIAPGDPNFPAGAVIPMTRAITDPVTGNVVNTLAGSLDLSQLYGSDAANVASLRNDDGTMKTSAGNALPIVKGVFVSGDVRVMENPELTAITTMFMREHNYWVGVLKDQHPRWSGDQLYDMAKAITTAEYQNIIYSEYLPTMVGPLAPYSGFDPNVNTQVSQEFSTSAFRVGHTQISGQQTGIDNQGNQVFTQSLAESFFNTPAIDLSNGVDALLRNLSNDDAQAVDVFAVNELRNLLSASPASIDLIAIDIQRERDLGIGTLNETRAALGLTPYTSFDDLTSDPVVAAKLAAQFGSIDDVDLFLGGVAENHAPGADVGETFQAIIGDQFTRLRAGDQFWWQNQGFDQQTETMIGQTTLADIIGRTTGTPALQSNVFISHQRHASDVAAAEPDAPQLVIGIDEKGAAIAGGVADDTLVAGKAVHQILTGGGGADVFMFIGSGHRGDVISDWNSRDVIAFQVTQSNKHASIDLMNVGGDAQVSYAGNKILLTGVDATTLTAGNFDLPPGDTVTLSLKDHGLHR